MPLNFADAEALDHADPLAHFRSEFVFDENPAHDMPLIYLDGNSLGRLPKRTQADLQAVIDGAWGQRLIRSWNEGWFEAPGRIGNKLAQLLGANSGEVVVADSTSVNLFKLVVAALQAQPGRTRIVTDDLNFPSDLYILQGVIDLLGGQHELVVVPSPDGIHMPLETLAAAIDDRTALVTLSYTAYKSGFTHDMAAVNHLAQAAGALMLWDLSHSVGSVVIELANTHADLAVGCTYKYVNGGPGAPAFLYVRSDLQTRLRNPISGWFGQHNPFEFGLNYQPEPDIRRFLTGTPPVLSILGVEAGVELLLAAGMPALREKSVQQTEFLIQLWREQLADLGFALGSPTDAARRGSHISLSHPDGLAIDLALIHEMNVLPDFRPPDSLRLGIAPIYTQYAELYEAVGRLRTAVTERRFEKYRHTRPAVS